MTRMSLVKVVLGGLAVAFLTVGGPVGTAQAQCLGNLETFSCGIVAANAVPLIGACNAATNDFCVGRPFAINVIVGDCFFGFSLPSADVITAGPGVSLVDGGELNDDICDVPNGAQLVASGGEGNDRIVGNGGSDFLSGDSGSDQLFGGNGNDVIFGNSGFDSINGGGGTDFCIGGLSLDTLPQGCEVSIQ